MEKKRFPKLRSFYGNTKWTVSTESREIVRKVRWRAELQLRNLTGQIHGYKSVCDLWSHGENPEQVFLKRMRELERPRVLEIGSRRIASPLDKSLLGPEHEYVGLDIQEGSNVDVVGDAHELSELFAANSFDGIYSAAVFEHIAMPWQVAREINRVLKPGGLVFIGTHHTYPNHELPWDFWRYGWDAFSSIFNADSGFTMVHHGLAHMATLVPWGGMRSKKQPGHYLFTIMLAQKTGEASPAKKSWSLPYQAALPADHYYPKNTTQLKNEKTDDAPEAEIHVPRMIDDLGWKAELAGVLGREHRGLVICSEHYPVEKILRLIPHGKEWDIEIFNPEKEDLEALLDGRSYDAVVATDVLGQVPHPWETAHSLASALRDGGLLITQERATPQYLQNKKEYWYFTSESLRLVYHPQCGFEQIASFFKDPVMVAPADIWGHRQVVHGPAFGWTCGIFRKSLPILV